MVTQGESSQSGQTPTCMPDPPRSDHGDAVDRFQPASERRMNLISQSLMTMNEAKRRKEEGWLEKKKWFMESSRTSSRSRAPSAPRDPSGRDREIANDSDFELAQRVTDRKLMRSRPPLVRARIILALLFVAFWMQAIASISPLGPAKISMIKVFFTGFDDPSLSIGTFQNVTHISLGIWQAYYYSANGSEMHTPISFAGNAYIFTVDNEMQDHSLHATIHRAWPRGLAIQPIACAVTVVFSLLFLYDYLSCTGSRWAKQCSQKPLTMLLLLAFVASFIAVTANWCIFRAVQNEMKTLRTGGDTAVHATLGPGFWLSFVGYLLLLFALLLKICDHRRTGIY